MTRKLLDSRCGSLRRLLPFLYRHKAGPLWSRIQQCRRSRNRLHAILPDLRLAAVVQQQIRPHATSPIAPNPLFQIRHNLLRRNRSPIETCHVPQHRNHAQLSRRAQNIRPPRPVRRPKVCDPLAESVFQSRTCHPQLLADLAGRPEQQHRMRPSMVSHHMARFANAPDQRNSFTRESPDNKECRVNLMPRENIQKLLRACVIRPVIIGQSQFVGFAPSDQSSPKNLRLRPHPRIEIAPRNQCGAYAGSSKRTKHKNSVRERSEEEITKLRTRSRSRRIWCCSD